MRTAFTYTIVQRWLFVVAVAVVVLMNYLSNAIPFGGQTMAEVSAKYPTLITPAGYAFAIWGIIYLTFAVYAFFQLTRGQEVRFYRLVWPYLMINFVANCLWLVAFQNEWMAVSVALMALILISLIVVFKLFYRLKRAMSTTHRYFFHVPFGLYFGWISLATIVNVAIFFSSLGWEWAMRSDELFAIALLIAAALLGISILISQRDYIFNFALIWGLIAIWVKQDMHGVELAAKFSSIALISACLIHFVVDRIKVSQYGRSRS